MDRNCKRMHETMPTTTLRTLTLLGLLLTLLAPAAGAAAPAGQAQAQPAAQPAPITPISGDSQACLDCHTTIHPGIVEDWKKSRHARGTPGKAMTAPELERRVSSTNIPDALKKTAVGCAECHMLRPKAHADTFDHNGYQLHVVVSPDDCATCHATEREQYDKNIMAHAYGNLADNPTYGQLVAAINDIPTVTSAGLTQAPASATDAATSCYYCHGTKLAVSGTETRDTALGEMDFPVITGWPNNGVGRVNLDGSLGSCAACHPRHQFAIEVARSAQTCEECHNGPDVPAYKVWAASKHGNIEAALGHGWNFTAVPWTMGKDFTAPTCAACHVSLVINTEGEVVAQRSHQVTDRLPWRIFGLPYAHSQPKSPVTSLIVNADGQHLPTNLDGSPAADFLIDAAERDARRAKLTAVCLGCHDRSWVDGHWNRFEANLKDTNTATLAATRLIQQAWSQELAKGPSAGGNPYDEFPERLWADVWLFHANHIRFTAAMAGGGDYGVFADGRYSLTRTVRELDDWLARHAKPGK